jgi:hypothetical protein
VVGFVGLALFFFVLAVLSAFTYGSAAATIVLALFGMIMLASSRVAGASNRGGRRSPRHLGPGGPDDPDAHN